MEKSNIEKLSSLSVTQEREIIIREGYVEDLIQNLTLKFTEFAVSYKCRLETNDRLEEFYRNMDLAQQAYGHDEVSLVDCQNAAFNKCIINSYQVKLAEFGLDLMNIIQVLQLKLNLEYRDSERESRINSKGSIYSSYMDYVDILCVMYNNYIIDQNQMHASSRLAEKLSLLLKMLISDCKKKHNFDLMRLIEEVHRYRMNNENREY